MPQTILSRCVLIFLAAFGLLPRPGFTQSAALTPAAALQELAGAERAFARASVDQGMFAAFLDFFAPGGINFTPHPVGTVQSIKEMPEDQRSTAMKLDWWPAFGDVSSAGDLGYTTGPYTMADANQNNRIVQQGFYFSVWKRQSSGDWRVEIDYGVETPTLAGAGAAAKFQPSSWVGSQEKIPSPTTPVAIRARDSEFGERVARDGLLAAYRGFTSWNSETRLYRNQQSPLIGPDAMAAGLSAEKRKLTWLPLGSDVAKSGDLAYSFGRWDTVEDSPTIGYYLRVWRRIGGAWLVVAEVMKPLPSL